MEIWKDLSFEAAHKLPNVPPGHKCGRLHGHSFKVRLTIRGDVDPTRGWIMDFARIKELWKPFDKALDHNYLNDVQGLENPTSEILAAWLGEKLSQSLGKLLYSVTVQETCTAGAVWRNPLHKETKCG